MQHVLKFRVYKDILTSQVHIDCLEPISKLFGYLKKNLTYKIVLKHFKKQAKICIFTTKTENFTS